MKSFNLFLITSFLLTACASSQVTASPTNTHTPTQISFTPTEKPLTPTFTPDPLAGAPEGVTGKNANGEWIMEVITANNNEVIYTWDPELGTYFRIFVERMPLLDLRKASNDVGIHDQMWMTVYIDNRVPNEIGLPTISHPPVSDDPKAVDWQRFMGQDLRDNLKARGLPIDDLYVRINNGETYFSFTTKEGDFKWVLNQNVTVRIRGDYQELLEGIETNGFSKARDIYTPDRTFNSDFMVRYWTDDKGNLYCDIAPKTPADKWSQRQILEIILFAPMNIIEREDQVTPGPYNLLSQYVQTHAMNKTYPFFVLGPPP
jgi:outer membrane protein assembly factor BamB